MGECEGERTSPKSAEAMGLPTGQSRRTAGTRRELEKEVLKQHTVEAQGCQAESALSPRQQQAREWAATFSLIDVHDAPNAVNIKRRSQDERSHRLSPSSPRAKPNVRPPHPRESQRHPSRITANCGPFTSGRKPARRIRVKAKVANRERELRSNRADLIRASLGVKTRTILPTCGKQNRDRQECCHSGSPRGHRQ